MQFSDALCYALMITITSTWVNGAYAKQGLERKSDRRGKRESSVIIDSSYPSTTFAAKPDVIFDRVSKSKFNSKVKHGRSRPQYGRSPHSQRDKPMKKYRRKLVRAHKLKKYGSAPNSHLRKHPLYTKAPKPASSKMPEFGYSPPKLFNEYHPFYLAEPASFAEPPKYVNQEYERNPQKSHGEPPVDSYGVPVKHADLHVPIESNQMSARYPNLQTVEPFAETPKNGIFDQQQQQYQSYQSYQQDANVDSVSSYSKKHPVNQHHEREVQEANQPIDHDITLHSYADVYKQSLLNDFNPNTWSQKKKNYHSVIKNRPWKTKINNEGIKDNPLKHVMVGGQYAEPPGHLVPDFQPSLPEKFPGASYFGSNFGFTDSEFAGSPTVSPYVNYKNSNMAFSPQNLNDAFSL